MNRKRVVVAGLGDVGVLTAIRLARHADVVGISAKPALVSGQELGVRLSRPEDWARDYWIPFDKFRRLDDARTVQATLTGLDLAARTVLGRRADGTTLEYDALVISTGVSDGFWRRPTLQSPTEIGADLRAAHDRLADADSVIVVGGGAAAVSSAVNIATAWPGKRVDLYFRGERALGEYHPATWQRIRDRLIGLGVGLHRGNRARVSDGFAGEEITGEPVHWSTGQPPASADAALWAIGRVRPNTDWLPPELLNERGFVRVTPQLRVPGHRGVVRGRGRRGHRPSPQLRPQSWRCVGSKQRSRPVRRSGPARLPDPGPAVGFVGGHSAQRARGLLPRRPFVAFPLWSVERVVMPWIVRWGKYRGVRENQPLPERLGRGLSS
jgi:apoptosis-inducing factor 2